MEDSFVIDLLSFLVQNCNPLNLEIKLDGTPKRGGPLDDDDELQASLDRFLYA